MSDPFDRLRSEWWSREHNLATPLLEHEEANVCPVRDGTTTVPLDGTEFRIHRSSRRRRGDEMSAAILDRQQESSDESAASAPTRVRPAAPARRQPATRPATRQASVEPPLARPSVGCAHPVGGEPLERGYRMGRWARLTVTLSVLATAGILLFGGPAGSASSTTDIVTTTGQTVWSIARDAAGPSASPQAVGALVDSIRVVNALEGTGTDQVLPVGLRLLLPAH